MLGFRKRWLGQWCVRGGRKSRAVATLIEDHLFPAVQAVKGLAPRIEFRTPPDALVVTYENLPFVMVERTVLQAMPLVAGSEALRQDGKEDRPVRGRHERKPSARSTGRVPRHPVHRAPDPGRFRCLEVTDG
ncbi:hypothetical protein ACFVGY_06455 [Streptomyces sp. NPDC127106]|uniref:hypothetical protein n=1 Tax=Streptomyces sp. NPDC127106 TaxID=3345360 RepID=UPI00362CC51A